MLKFIPVSVTLACLFSSFQNILCWSLSEQDAISTVPCTISKHLMLKFITRSLVPLQLVFAFQNILCWSLSVKATMEELAEKNFKTSYVEVYPDSSNCLLSTLYISKHLMLKFIRGRNPVGIFFHKFQNILCWSLSQTFGKCMIRCLHFKTSYVEVYPEPPVSINMNHINFKTSYVEVYHDINEEKAKYRIFQNILCWSLSHWEKRLLNSFPHFKTSYVEVYHLRKQEA